MKPSIGRIVHFHPTPDVTQAAIIAYVHSDTLVNLTVFDGNGNSQGKTSVPLVAPDSGERPNGYYCEWMPFQVQQTQKQAEPVLFPVDKETAEALVRIIKRFDAACEAEFPAVQV